MDISNIKPKISKCLIDEVHLDLEEAFRMSVPDTLNVKWRMGGNCDYLSAVFQCNGTDYVLIASNAGGHTLPESNDYLFGLYVEDPSNPAIITYSSEDE